MLRIYRGLSIDTQCPIAHDRGKQTDMNKLQSVWTTTTRNKKISTEILNSDHFPINPSKFCDWRCGLFLHRQRPWNLLFQKGLLQSKYSLQNLDFLLFTSSIPNLQINKYGHNSINILRFLKTRTCTIIHTSTTTSFDSLLSLFFSNLHPSRGQWIKAVYGKLI